MLQRQEAGLSLEKLVDAEFSVQRLKQAGPLASDLFGSRVQKMVCKSVP